MQCGHLSWISLEKRFSFGENTVLQTLHLLPRGCGMDGESFTVPEGCYFLMGDNRNHSLDSRFSEVGMVDGRYILGKAWGIVFPGQDVLQNNARDLGRIGSVYD